MIIISLYFKAYNELIIVTFIYFLDLLRFDSEIKIVYT